VGSPLVNGSLLGRDGLASLGTNADRVAKRCQRSTRPIGQCAFL